MKRLICFLLLFSLCAGILTGCSAKYPAQKSTGDESRVVMTISLDGEKYDIKYELYRALFFARHTELDGGDAGVWASSESEQYVEKINELIASDAAKIYAAIHIAEKLGFDLYSKEVKKQIEEYIATSVEGNEADIIGYGGDYDAYLAALSDRGINYSVQELLFRYAIALEKINEYYIGTSDDALGYIPGEYEVTDSEVRDFYFGDESVRILHAYMQADVVTDAEIKMQTLAESISSLEPLEAALYIINHTAATPTDLIINKNVSGIVFGKYTVNSVYEEYSSAAFALSAGEVSELIEINDGSRGYYVIYGLEKSEQHFEDCFEDVKAAYLDNLIGLEIQMVQTALAESAELQNGYYKISHEEILNYGN